ncbi:hypothetical protein E2562_035514 [Oryza meyeriana var. granulata]|uniref:Uncharacterized protein n=1 Tax=Oryza meyeriana var. granulata TaxID=110450 RepID=A0A6G1DCA7_9ORYZ|nr:hypothetical protein E2562_035514 [Oryza meyeriana var. granulata]
MVTLTPVVIMGVGGSGISSWPPAAASRRSSSRHRLRRGKSVLHAHVVLTAAVGGIHDGGLVQAVDLSVHNEFRLVVEPRLSVSLPMGIVISLDEMFYSGGNSSPHSLLDMLLK